MMLKKKHIGLLYYGVLLFLTSSSAIFVKENWLDGIRTNQKNYGVAVSDVNHDGRPDFIVAGYNGPNFVLVFDPVSGNVTNIAQEDSPAFSALRDLPGNAIGTSNVLLFYCLHTPPSRPPKRLFFASKRQKTRDVQCLGG